MKRAGIIFFIFVIIITGTFKLVSLTGPVAKYSNSIVPVKIQPGSTGYEIGEILYNKDLINSKPLFNLLITILGVQDELQAGYYELSQSENMWKIINKISSGKVATVKVTIPEGFTVEEIAERLSKLTSYDKDIFINLAKTDDFNKDYLSLSEKQNYILEGFLYPDTYIIPKESGPRKYFEVMLKEFEERWLTKLNKEQDRIGFSPFEIVTIASLVEKEARLDKEKPIIAAVIYNRLKRKMLLQIDASIQYVLPERKERIYYRDLDIDSTYNTYLYPGLPPGPICSPGDSSIQAALHPAEVDYLFYFALDDGSHVFTENYQEHLKLQKELRGSK